ncbi:hypothetical protein PsYK624_003850 [Phanerochaete sordida]|uniref:Uncharacterized protein n=1 Tax=Phanerochaete sordida TaxID=48140 RepID=A0A9P3L7A9_9APHY|nr:hypothetical protein PsYK624_003850 [Phanerochaete sordida]
MTWFKTFGIWNELRRLRRNQDMQIAPSIAYYLLRDGTVYFVIVVALDIAQIVFFVLNKEHRRFIGTYFQPILQVAPGLIVCSILRRWFRYTWE